MRRSGSPDAHELQVLLSKVFSTTAKPSFATHYYSVSCIQGRFGGGHRTHGEVD